MTNSQERVPLEKFKRAAKTLKAGYEAGDLDARMRIKTYLAAAKGDLKHADFLHVIAQENTFVSWPAMKDAIETIGLDRATKLQRLKIALYHGRTGRVQRLIEATPDLARGHFGLLCALLDSDAVWTMLGDDPALATTQAGPELPLVHLCKSRMFTVWDDKAPLSVAIANMLVTNGADVNVGSVENNEPLSPLFWALGHAGNMPLAQWLLENGANPNDGESLYHATEIGHADGLRLLLSHGATPTGTNALPRAMDFDNAEMVGLLLIAGADPNEGSDDWAKETGGKRGVPTLHHAAYRMSTAPVIDLLLQHGADPAATLNGVSAYSYARVFGNSELASKIEGLGLQTPLNDLEAKLAAAATGVVPDGYIDTAKLPEAYRYIIHEILHLPNKLAHLKALVAIGFEWDMPNKQGVTPVQLAGWNGLPDVMEYFLKLAPNLGHVNGYGGTLLSTILHGSENAANRDRADHLSCLRMALEHGVALPKRVIEFAGRDDMRDLMVQWAKDKPGQVVEHGIA